MGEEPPCSRRSRVLTVKFCSKRKCAAKRVQWEPRVVVCGDISSGEGFARWIFVRSRRLVDAELCENFCYQLSNSGVRA